MIKEELERFLREKIPLTEALGVKVHFLSEQRIELWAPLHPNHNHMGTAFGGSLSTLMILAGYSWLYEVLQERGESVHVILQSQEVQYIAPVQGDIRAICLSPDGPSLKEFFKTYDRKGLARLTLHPFIEIAGEKAASMKGVFVAQRVSS